MYFEPLDSASIVSNSATSKHGGLKAYVLFSLYPCSLGNRFLVEIVKSFVNRETMGMQNLSGNCLFFVSSLFPKMLINSHL